MNTNQWLRAGRDQAEERHKDHFTKPWVICADGFNFSVQANKFVYCIPQKSVGPYTHVEVGFPSATPELIMDYCDDPEDPSGTVYGYVPIELVDQLVELHGGWVRNRIENGEI